MLVVVNTRAGRGAMRHAWPKVREVLEAAGLEYEVAPTERPGHATELARAGIESGIRYVVAVGGDGTVHEVVNGMMGENGPLDPEAVLGVVPSGSGSDFGRTYGMAQDPAIAAQHLAGDTLWGRIDVARIAYTAFDGTAGQRWFANIAEVGIGGDVVVEAVQMPKWLGGLTYRLAAVKAITRFRPQRASIRMNARAATSRAATEPLADVVHESPVSLVVIANGQFFGGNLRVVPRAIPSDGMLDVLIASGTKWDGIRMLQRMPSGTHIPSPNVLEYLANSLSMDAPRPMTVEADGEPLGTTPVTVDLVPAALRLKI